MKQLKPVLSAFTVEKKNARKITKEKEISDIRKLNKSVYRYCVYGNPDISALTRKNSST